MKINLCGYVMTNCYVVDVVVHEYLRSNIVRTSQNVLHISYNINKFLRFAFRLPEIFSLHQYNLAIDVGTVSHTNTDIQGYG